MTLQRYTVIMGIYSAPTYWMSGPSFFEAKRVEVDAPSAYDAKCRALEANPHLQVSRVQYHAPTSYTTEDGYTFYVHADGTLTDSLWAPDGDMSYASIEEFLQANPGAVANY